MRTARPSRSAKRARRHDRIAAILQAAQDVFLEQGYDAASLDAVARRANASKATIYAHFGNKQGLFEAIVQGFIADLAVPLQAIDRPSKDVLTRFGTAFLTFMLSPVPLSFYRLIVSKGQGMPEMAKLWYAQGPRRMIGALAGFLESRARAGELDISDSETAAELFLMSLRGTLHLQAVTGLAQPPYDSAVVLKVKAAVEMFLRAYACKPPRRRNSP